MKLRNPEMLKLLMQQHDQSLRTLGDAADVHFTFIHKLVRGTKSTCTPRTAEAIARTLHVPLEVLFEPKLPTAASRSDIGRKAA